MTLPEFLDIAQRIGPGKDCIVEFAGTGVRSGVGPAKLQLEEGSWYLCQNIKPGTSPMERFGFSFGWKIYSESDAAAIVSLKAVGSKELKEAEKKLKTLFKEYLKS